MHSQYYEAILQVRPRRGEVESFIEQKVNQSAGKVWISKKKVMKNSIGSDYYLSSWKFAASLGNQLIKRFGGTIAISRKLFGRKQGKEIYRSAVLYKAPAFITGEIIGYDEKVLRISSVGKKTMGRDLTSGKNVEIKDDPLRISRLEVLKTTITKHHPQVEAMNPEDYQNIALKNAQKTDMHIGKSVDIVIHQGKGYLIR